MVYLSIPRKFLQASNKLSTLLEPLDLGFMIRRNSYLFSTSGVFRFVFQWNPSFKYVVSTIAVNKFLKSLYYLTEKKILVLSCSRAMHMALGHCNFPMEHPLWCPEHVYMLVATWQNVKLLIYLCLATTINCIWKNVIFCPHP